VSEATQNKVLVVGLDGICFDLLRPWIDAGHLPVLREMTLKGAFGALESAIPPITPVCWTTFMTGKNPGRHGVYEFLLRTGSGIEEVPVDSSRRNGSTLWEILGRSGKKSIVLNVPVTFPPTELNGLMVSGFLTPRGNTNFTYPSQLREEIENKFGPYKLYLNEAYVPGRAEIIVQELTESLDYKCRVARYLMQKHPWNFFMVHILGTDRIQHELMHLIDPAHPNRREQEARDHGGKILDYFRRVDKELGRLMETAGPKTTTIVMSDHGSGPIYKFMHFNVWLLEGGFIRLKPGVLTRLKHALFKAGITPETAYKFASKFKMGSKRVNVDLEKRSSMIKLLNRFFLSSDDIDWSRTRAFSKGNYGQMFVNLKGREENGSVGPGEEYEAVRAEIIEKLKEITDPETGENIIGPIYKGEDIYEGPFAPRAPDVFFLPRDMSYHALGTFEFMAHKFLRPVYGLSGDHRMNGVFLAKGPQVKAPNEVKDIHLMDIAATVLYLLGEAVPEDMDGMARTDIFTDDFVAANPLRYCGGDKETTDKGEGLNSDEAEEIKRRLKALGYLG